VRLGEPVLLSVLVLACGRSSGSGASGVGTASASSAGLSLPASAPTSWGSALPSLPESGGLPPLPTIRSRCCRLDRTEGIFGPEKGIHSRYSGDVLLRNDGERLLFPQDLISDTKELYQFAKSSGKSLYQERRIRIVGEGTRHVSVEIEERGETGANTPFYHLRYATFDTRKKRAMTLEEALPGRGGALLEEARRRYEGSPGKEQFRFVSTSFALTEGEVRFCCAAKDDRQPGPRLEVSVGLGEGQKLVLHRGRW
jgi:hypothetical protein